MLAKSAKQTRYLRAISHDPAFAAKVGASQSVGRETPVSAPSEIMGAPRAPKMAITLPGGAVQSGSYLEGTKFGTPAMPKMRKVRA